jgi:hypothetical protein
MEGIALRCSALPLAFLCAGSVRTGDLVIDETHPAAGMGTACHDGLRALPAAGRVDWNGVPELAKRHGVPEPELRMLLGQGQKLWAQLKDSFPDAVTEERLFIDLPGGHSLSGHLDLLGKSHRTAHVGDWKTGRLDSDYREQLIGYCALALLDDDSLEEATAGVIWLREGEWEHYTMRKVELPAYLRRVQREIIDWDGTFRAGEHCTHCPRSHECPARQALVRRDVAAFLGGELTDYAVNADALAALPGGQLVALLASADMVQEIAERLRRAIRELVERDGDIVADGKRLTIQKSARRHLHVVPALDVLDAAGFTDDEKVSALEVHLKAAQDVVAAKAPYRGKKKAIEKLLADLDAAGAVHTKEVTQLVTRRA